eukprot:gb/GECG01009725.1/.p1 GENE.gb/GECG01009725.1/~~gb/GECG01009725.1/.p1  ORF type:complete len:142 (+),score=4.99 gb/GECG01009725.1/:1-426(+)
MAVCKWSMRCDGVHHCLRIGSIQFPRLAPPCSSSLNRVGIMEKQAEDNYTYDAYHAPRCILVVNKCILFKPLPGPPVAYFEEGYHTTPQHSVTLWLENNMGTAIVLVRSELPNFVVSATTLRQCEAPAAIPGTLFVIIDRP